REGGPAGEESLFEVGELPFGLCFLQPAQGHVSYHHPAHDLARRHPSGQSVESEERGQECADDEDGSKQRMDAEQEVVSVHEDGRPDRPCPLTDGSWLWETAGTVGPGIYAPPPMTLVFPEVTPGD